MVSCKHPQLFLSCVQRQPLLASQPRRLCPGMTAPSPEHAPSPQVPVFSSRILLKSEP